MGPPSLALPATSLLRRDPRHDRDDLLEATAALRARSWDWLIGLRRHLRVAVQVVDGHFEPVLTRTNTPAGTALAGAIASGAAPLRTAVSNALLTRAPQAVRIGRVLVQCVAIVSGDRAAGALLVAREAPASDGDESGRTELETVAAALASAASAHLATIAEGGEDLAHVGTFERLLSAAGDRRTEHEMVAAFADALAIWHDIDLRGYLEAGGDDYLLDVTLPGADLSAAPSRIPASWVPEADLTMLPLDQVERFGATPDVDAAVARIGRGRGSWLLVLSGRLDVPGVAWIELCVGLLARWMAYRTADATARLTSGMARDLFESSESPELAVRRALDRLEAEMGVTAILSVTASTGVPIVRVGERATRVVDGMIVMRREPGCRSVTLAIASSRGRLDGRDCGLASAAADLFDAWSRTVAQTRGTGERRHVPGRTDLMLEQFARDALAEGIEVSAIVLAAPEAAVAPDRTQAWLARIRGCVRVTDIAGVLGDGELGVLLHGISPERAEMVAARLHRVSMMGPDEVAFGRTLSIGIAGRAPGTLAARPLIDDARAAGARPAQDR